MARINIEDSLFKDPRYSELIITMGSRHAALGAFVEACILAQEFFLNEETERLIPLTEWKRRKAVGFLIDVGLAELKGENNQYVYIVGSDKQFSWLIQRKEAGKKGGRPSKKENANDTKSNKTQNEKTTDNRPLSPDNRNKTGESGSNPLTLSLTHDILSSKEDNINTDLSNSKINPLLPESKKSSDLHPLIKIWNEYATAKELTKVLKTNRYWNTKINSVYSDLSFEEWVEVVKRINASDFCKGTSDQSKGWVATFDWLLQKETHLKVLQGKYDNREKNKKSFENERPESEQMEDFNRLVDEVMGR